MGTDVFTDNIEPAQEYFYIREQLENSMPYLVHEIPGTRVPFKKRNGMKIKFRRHNPLAVANTPGVEGVTEDPAETGKVDFEATLKWYKNWVKVSDIAVDVNVEDLRLVYTKQLGDNMGVTKDIIDRDLLQGGSSVYYGNNVAGRDSVITKVEENDLRAIDRQLFRNKAKYFTAMTKGDVKHGTSSILPAYLCLAHGDTKGDWEDLTGWKPVSDYAGQTAIYPSEIGSYGNFRVILTQHGKVHPDAGGAAGALISTSGVKADIYPILIFGKDAFKYCPLDGSNVKNIVHDFGSGGSEDPTNDRMTIAYKFATTLCITQDLNMFRYEIGSTA